MWNCHTNYIMALQMRMKYKVNTVIANATITISFAFALRSCMVAPWDQDFHFKINCNNNPRPSNVCITTNSKHTSSLFLIQKIFTLSLILHPFFYGTIHFFTHPQGWSVVHPPPNRRPPVCRPDKGIEGNYSWYMPITNYWSTYLQNDKKFQTCQ